MQTESVFRLDWKFYRLWQKFRGKLKPTMKWARECYKEQWRRTSYYHPAIAPAVFFRDDYRWFKDNFWGQTIYFKWTWCLYRREANTCELRITGPIYAINDEWKIGEIGTQTKWCYSSSMFDLEPVDKFPREWWTLIPGESFQQIDWAFWWNTDVFINLWWPDAIWIPSQGLIYNMYWSWKPYHNWYNSWYIYVDGQAYLSGTEPGHNQTPEEHLNNVITTSSTYTDIPEISTVTVARWDDWQWYPEELPSSTYIRT